MRISKSTKTSVKASSCVELPHALEVFLEDVAQSVGPFDYTAFMGKCWTASAINELKELRRKWNKSAEDDEAALDIAADIQKVLDGLKSKSVGACDSIKGSTDTDKALQHIRAAIDILGKSGNKDDVTKDSIANLGVVYLDLSGKK